jgi:hypothetical protein
MDEFRVPTGARSNSENDSRAGRSSVPLLRNVCPSNRKDLPNAEASSAAIGFALTIKRTG